MLERSEVWIIMYPVYLLLQRVGLHHRDISEYRVQGVSWVSYPIRRRETIWKRKTFIWERLLVLLFIGTTIMYWYLITYLLWCFLVLENVPFTKPSKLSNFQHLVDKIEKKNWKTSIFARKIIKWPPSQWCLIRKIKYTFYYEVTIFQVLRIWRLPQDSMPDDRFTG